MWSGRKAVVAALGGGFVAGMLVMGVCVVLFMPGMMIQSFDSRLGFDETVARLESTITEEGWSSPGTMDMNKALAKHGASVDGRIKLVKLCKAPYAQSVLATDRYVSCLMPCTIAVYEDDEGGVHISKMNTGLMGTLFGGNIAKVMGGAVAEDEKKILASVIIP